MSKEKCIWCGEDASNPEYWASFLGRALYFCPTDFTLMKQLFKNMQGIRQGLQASGINIGVPTRRGKNDERQA